MTSKTFTYADCLCGRAPVPQAGAPGKVFFTLLMVGGMVTFMVTFNGLKHCGWDAALFFGSSLWLYPVVFVVAALVRVYIGDKAVGWAVPRFVAPYFNGLAKSIVMTLLNITVMCPLMSALVTLLLTGPVGFLPEYLDALPISFAFALVVNYFVVGPVVKMLHNNVISSDQGMAILLWFDKNIRPLMVLLGS